MTLVDQITERRLLASLIAEPHVLAMADDVEEQDFSDPRCQHVLRAIRSLRSADCVVTLDEIDREIRLADMAREVGDGVVVDGNGLWTFGAGTLSDKAGFWFIAEVLTLHFAPYRDEIALVNHDMAWLRELSRRRRELLN